MAFRDKLREILHIKDTPHRIAIAFAFGIFMGISPFLGFHTIGAFFIAWFFGLNRFVAVVGTCTTNPWTIVPIYSFSLWVGARLIGIKKIIPDIDWGNVTFMNMMGELAHLIIPFIVGSFLVGAVSGLLGYFIIYNVVLRYRNRIKNPS